MSPEQAVIDACESFQSFAVQQMIYDWVRNSPSPQMVVNLLISGWKKSQNDFWDQQAKQIFEQTGVIANGADRALIDRIIAEAEQRIRESFEQMLADSQEVDELAKAHLSRQGVQ